MFDWCPVDLPIDITELQDVVIDTQDSVDLEEEHEFSSSFSLLGWVTIAFFLTAWHILLV